MEKIFFFGQRNAANFLIPNADAKNNILYIILDLINVIFAFIFFLAK
jgi:hypothetical protein